MRPAGDVSRALLQAVVVLAAPDRGVTLRELAAEAQVNVRAASTTIKNMVRGGRIAILGTRRVPGRNRPVAEYGTAINIQNAANDADMNLSDVMRFWG